MLQVLNDDYFKHKFGLQCCGGTATSVSQFVENFLPVYYSNGSINTSETVQPDTSMLETETTGASHSHKKKRQLNETMGSMEHTAINKWPNSCKSHMQL